jgi:2OG-Fe(II) oxygenase superfamily
MADKWTNSIVRAIKAVDRPGLFCCTGVVAPVSPGLMVKGVGTIGLPLSDTQAEQLKSVCIQAPHGKGDKTVLDTSVRKVWKLSNDQFTLENPQWQASLDAVVEQVGRELGLADRLLEAHLYDLLLYEKGGFFLPHKDGERLDRMVATLVVVLPCEFSGGELIVRHEGEEKVIDFANSDARFRPQFAAFYADCEHEVKPLASGHRLCLVYNLTVGKSTAVAGASRQSEHVDRLAMLFADWCKLGREQDKLAITLEHEYTEDGLRWNTLKGVDRERALIIASAASNAGCHANLAQVTYWKFGSNSGEQYYGRSRDRSSWHIHEEGKAADKVKMEELLDSSLTAEHWYAPGDVKLPMAALPLEESEVLPQGAIKKIKPKSEVDGYLGNEGLTVNRWYRRAAIVVWPEDRHVDVLVSTGSHQALAELDRMIDEPDRLSSTAAPVGPDREKCLRLASAILSSWPTYDGAYLAWNRARDAEKVVDPIDTLIRLDDVSLIQRYLSETLGRDLRLQPAKAIANLVKHHEPRLWVEALAKLFAAAPPHAIGRNAEIFRAVAKAVRTSTKAKRKAAELLPLGALAEHLSKSLIARAALPVERYSQPNHGNTIDILVSLTSAILHIDNDDVLANVVSNVTHDVKTYPLRQVQIASLRKILSDHKNSGSKALATWTAHVTREFEQLTTTKPQPPVDLARPGTVDCKCADCRVLNQFLTDPQVARYEFHAAVNRRNHLEDQISRNHCDLDCGTEKRSNPHILVVTKNTNSYKRQLAEYESDLGHLKFLASTAA